MIHPGYLASYENSGYETSDLFLDVTKKVPLGSGAEREIDDIVLTRYALKFNRLGSFQTVMKKRFAFTLIELLIVVAIIGILAAIAVPNFLNAQLKAKISRVRADMKAVQISLEAYKIDHNTYLPHHAHPAGQSWNRNIYSYLTTPVAYLNAEAEDGFNPAGEVWPDDPFAQSHLPIYCYKASQFYRSHPEFYDVTPDDEVAIAFGVYSYGPDKDWDDVSIFYQLSNGLRSTGDLAQFGGASGGWFTRTR